MRALMLMLTWAGLSVALAQTPPKLPPEQQETLKKANQLDAQGAAFQKAGNFKAAITAVEEGLLLKRAIFPPTYAQVLASIDKLARLNELTDDFPSAIKRWKELLALRNESLGKDHWQTVDAKLGLQNAEQVNGLSTEQLSLLVRARKARAQCIALNDKREFAEAIPIAEKVVQVRKEILGAKHPFYANSLNTLAILYTAQGQFAKAEPLFLEELKILKEVLGEKHPLYGNGLGYFGGTLRSLGAYAKAEPFLIESLKVYQAVYGENHLEFVTSLNMLGLLYLEQEQYSKAEPLFAKALKISKETVGDKHRSYADSLSNLAGVMTSQGQYSKAEPLYVEALKIRKDLLGAKHPQYAVSLNNLGMLYEAQSQYSKAEPLLVEALKIRKDTVGEKAPVYAASLNNLALLYKVQSQYSKAEPLLVEALKIIKDELGGKHLKYAASLDNLAGLHLAQGGYAKAESLSTEALNIRKETLGEKHPGCARGMNNLANICMIQGKHAQAEVLYRRAVAIQQAHLEECALIQSESDQLRHVAVTRVYLDNYLSLPIANAASLYAAVFRWHGAVTARQTFNRMAAVGSSELRSSVEVLRDSNRQLNQLTQNPPEGIAKAELAQRVKELDDQRELLQKNLAGRSKDFAAYLSHLGQTPANLQRNIPDDTALIDFLAYGQMKPTISVFIITKTKIRRIVLNVGKELDDELAAFLGDLSLGRTRPVTGDDDVSAKLRKRIWEPLEPHLKGISRVLICPDGPLCRLPFAALPGSDPKKYLLEELSIIVVPVPQLLPGLLAAESRKPAGAASLLAVGDVDFNGDPAAGQAKKPLPVAISRSGGGLEWKPLPNTKGEVETIEALFAKVPQSAVKKLIGSEATEAALEAELPKHRYLHLATHGFFTPPKFVRQIKENQAPDQEAILIPSVPPGLSSGIVCAGANKPTFQASGVLTATQIAELDLSGVELVVLSACETGLGELAGGEGVLGLQRAFQIAGARSTVSTLWSVDDRATAELMKRLYANRLENDLSSAEALREAQLWVLNNGDKVGAFDAPPRAGKRTPPKFWAAFTFAGDWR